MTFEQRFEKIEKENQALKSQTRNLRKLAWGAVAIALAGFVGGTALSVRAYTAAIEPASITTQSIVLKDSAGRVRLFLNGLSGQVVSQDESGLVRAAMGGGTIHVRDSNAKIRVRLNAADNKIYFYNASGGLVAQYP